MNDGKFYWLKMPRDYLKRHDIKILEKRTNGAEIVLFYLKLMLESVDHEGQLRFSNDVPYTEEMLADITDTPPEIVEQALDYFYELKLIEYGDDKTFYMTKVPDLIGSATNSTNANRQRRYREAQKEDERNASVTKCNALVTPPVTENNESKSKSKSKSYIKENIQEKRFVAPTLADVQDYIKEKSLNVDAERFIDYYTANGWRVGKNPMKDWRATVRNWSRQNMQDIKPKQEVSYDSEKVKARAERPIV